MSVVNTEAILKLVDVMNELKDSIDPAYGKIAIVMKKGPADNAECVRYFIQKRAIMTVDGIERWAYVARESK